MTRKRILCNSSFVFLLGWSILFAFEGVANAAITGKIAGIITDAETGEPLPGVNVLLEGTQQGAATDEDGHYFIINIEPGTYSVRASMIGYAQVTKTEVLVSTDHTTPVDFELQPEAIAGEAITIEAEREIIPMDVSASQLVSESEEIAAVPTVTDINEYINMQVGIENMTIRGGGQDQTEFMMDGLMVVDNRTNSPMMMVNLSAVKELNIIKGGFNAEYGNVRSGLINVITKEGSPTAYHGSLDLRLSPAHRKHMGLSILDPNNYYLRPYLDPAVCWEGTNNGAWDESMQLQYPEFKGWNAIAEERNADDIAENDVTPQEARDLFLWRHGLPGSNALMPDNYTDLTGRSSHELQYGNKPDWLGDASFGGPVPFIGQALGDLSFFASYRTNWETFGLPSARDYYKESNGQLKFTSRLNPSMKLTVEGLYGETNAIAGSESGGEGILYSKGKGIPDNNLYLPWTHEPVDIYRNMIGLSFDHVLTPSTFYNVRISHVRVTNTDYGFNEYRDRTTLRYFGSTPVDEVPYGGWWLSIPEGVGMMHPAHIYEMNLDNSQVNTLNAKFDLTSQVNRYNQIKTGLLINYDDISWDEEQIAYGQEHHNYHNVWTHYPLRAGAYVQDKLEFEGMIANFGLRLDYNNPNCDWFTVDRYSKYFRKEYKDEFTQVTPQERAKGHLKISPRLGISHPISTNTKLYFNYGHFYSMAPTADMYHIDYGQPGRLGGIEFIGNPSAELPKTVAYELGLDYNVADLFLLHLAGYYKDVTDQTGTISYQDFDGLVNYGTVENNNYEDIRGFELRIDKRWGKWITGWVNYNYMVTTSGYIGREYYYEDIRQQRIYGLQNPYQERPLARPILRVNVNFRTPDNWGPTLAGRQLLSNLSISPLFYWKSGDYETWDPLNTYELQDNLHWKASYYLDLRLSKRVRFRGHGYLTLFADFNNVLNTKVLNSMAFQDNNDRTDYFRSLHLPMYEGEEYQSEGLVPGNDKPGDLRSDDKPYINDPNRGPFMFLNPRSVFFGLKLDF